MTISIWGSGSEHFVWQLSAGWVRELFVHCQFFSITHQQLKNLHLIVSLSQVFTLPRNFITFQIELSLIKRFTLSQLVEKLEAVRNSSLIWTLNWSLHWMLSDTLLWTTPMMSDGKWENGKWEDGKWESGVLATVNGNPNLLLSFVCWGFWCWQSFQISLWNRNDATYPKFGIEMIRIRLVIQWRYFGHVNWPSGTPLKFIELSDHSEMPLHMSKPQVESTS